MDKFQEQLKLALFQEQKKLEEMENFYHYQEIVARELMYHAQNKLVEITQEKKQITKNSKDLDCVKEPKSFYERPFLFSDDR